MRLKRTGEAVCPGLLAQIPLNERIGSVTADDLCHTRSCHGAIAARGANAIIPPCRNAREWKGQIPAPRPVTRRCAPANGLGENGPDSTGEASGAPG